ncbi:hypothetical protein BH10ACI4_BH10ACI4_21120 [soil metagenome]
MPFRFAKAEQSFYILTFAICAVIHIATTVFDFPFIWVMPAMLPLALAILCSRITPRGVSFALPINFIEKLGFLLIAYSVILFIYQYRTTNGATGVETIDGQCVALYKSTIIKHLSTYECRHFPTLWTRVMSAWIAMFSCLGLSRSYEISAKLAR